MMGYMCIAIVCFPGCDVIYVEINLIFLIKPFFYMTEKSRQKFKYFENEEFLRWNCIFDYILVFFIIILYILRSVINSFSFMIFY